MGAALRVSRNNPAEHQNGRAQDGGGNFMHPIAGCHRRDSSLYGGSGVAAAPVPLSM